MSDTNRIRFAFGAESTYGTAPSGNPAIELRLTSESLKQDTGTVTSAEIRSDRNISDIIRTNVSASGDIAFEFSAATYDTFMQYALLSAGWSSPATLATEAATISFASSDNSVNDSANGFAAAVVGQWIKIEGAANAANNGYAKVVSKTAAKIVCSGITFTNESAGDGDVTVTLGAQIVNGVALSSFSCERKYDDLTNIFARYVGCCLEAMSFSVSSEAIITGTFSIMAKNETSQTATFGTSYTAPNTNSVMNGVDHVKKLLINNVDTDFTSFSFSFKNNLRGRMQVGDVGPVSIGTGTFEATGTVQAYFSTATLLNRYLDFDTTPLALCVEDDDGNGYVFEWPAVKLTAGQRPAPGQNQDVIADLQWSAFRSATELVTMRVTRF